MRLFRKYLALPGPERALLHRAVLLLWLFRVCLRVLPYRQVSALAARWARPGPGASTPPDLDRLEWILGAAARCLPGRRTCLTRALAGQVFLGRLGYPTLLRLGVHRPEEGGLEAHAWLECSGRVVVGAEERERYTALQPTTPRFP